VTRMFAGRMNNLAPTFLEEDFSGLCHELLLYTHSETAQDYLGIVLINPQLFNAFMILPLPLLLIAWYESERKSIQLSILTLSAVLLNSANVSGGKLALLGADYTSRRFATVEIDMLVAIGLGIYLAIMGRWIAAIAALLLGFAWFLAAVNFSV
jgi:hypothetical protein